MQGKSLKSKVKYEVEHYLHSMAKGFAVVGTDGTYIPLLTEAKASVIAFALNAAAERLILIGMEPVDGYHPLLRDYRLYAGPTDGI